MTLEARTPLSAAHSGVCLRYANQALFHPLAYLEGLARAFIGLGGTLRTGVHVCDIQDGAPPQLRTQDDTVIEARSVIVATNSPVNDRVTLHTKLYACITYVVALGVRG